MKPLSPFTYYRRHKGHAALLSSLITLVTAALVLIATVSGAIFVQPIRSNSMFLAAFSVIGAGLEGLDPALMARVRTNTDVERAILAKSVQIALPDITGGGTSWFTILALPEVDISYVLEKCQATIKEGEMIRPSTNGLLLSEQVAAILRVQVGDVLQNTANPAFYGNLTTPLTIAGILKSDTRLMLASYEYMSAHEAYAGFPDVGLVAAKAGRAQVVDEALRAEAQIAGAPVSTFGELSERLAGDYLAIYTLLAPIALVVILVTTLVVGVVNRIAFTGRLTEFGLLHAIGHSKGWLARRLTLETTGLAAAGWMVGVGLAWAALYGLKVTLFAPRGYDLDVIAWLPAAFTLPLPAVVIGGTLLTFTRVLTRLDTVAVVERGELSLEEHHQNKPTTSQGNPLASATFYRRHIRQAVLLTGTMALMIMAVALVVIAISASQDAQRASLGYLKRVSRVYARPGASLDPGVVTQVKAHPAVERVIPIGPRYGMASMVIPPFGEDTNASPFAVYTEDMAYLVDLYDLELLEGHLPRPHTNEMVIPYVLAQNRGLKVGDVIGDPDHPPYPGASPLPTPFVISGIFAPSASPGEENWLGFVSLEFMESHEEFSMQANIAPSLILVPKAGQKDALDDWLERELADEDVWVITYRQALAQARETTRGLLATLALIESVVAIVAAASLTLLNGIYIAQRQAEFGVLHTLGRARRWLVWRTMRETAFTTSLAWVISALVCLIAVGYLQVRVFAPMGLALNAFNLTPWLFTLPIPVAVLIATAGTVTRTLSRLDPVAIIERRA